MSESSVWRAQGYVQCGAGRQPPRAGRRPRRGRGFALASLAAAITPLFFEGGSVP
jgi:hypothetical protein